MDSADMPTDADDKRKAQFNKLMEALLSEKPSKFNRFSIYRASYASANFDIGVDIIVPKSKKNSGPRPVIVRIHGGFLITGSSLFPAWFTNWILDYAELHDAIIISPNYRLLPEVKGLDILKDVENFWLWFKNGGAQKHLHSVERLDVQLNVDRLMVLGESAGGYLALQSALCRFAEPRALILAYPMLDFESAHYTQRMDKPIVGVPNFPDKLVDDFLRNSNTTEAITEIDPPARLDLAMAIVQNGRFVDVFGTEPILFPLKNLAKVGTSMTLPPLFILHGEQDSAVPVEGSRKFVKELKLQSPSSKVHLIIRPGDHGFDNEATLAEPWLADGLRSVTEAWLNRLSFYNSAL